MMKILKYFISISVGIFCITAIIIVCDGLRDNVQKSDAIVILGNKVELTGQPSPRLISRLEKGFQVYQAKTAPLVIVTGGIGGEGFDEAKVMKQYLVEKGVPQDSILVDSQGIDTFSSAKNIKNILDKNNLHSVLVVSSYYHISRTVLAFEKNGIAKVHSAHANFFELRDLYSLPREVVGFYYYFFRQYGY